MWINIGVLKLILKINQHLWSFGPLGLRKMTYMFTIQASVVVRSWKKEWTEISIIYCFQSSLLFMKIPIVVCSIQIFALSASIHCLNHSFGKYVQLVDLKNVSTWTQTLATSYCWSTSRLICIPPNYCRQHKPTIIHSTIVITISRKENDSPHIFQIVD